MGVGLAASQPVRRILYGRAPAVTIHLGRRLPDGSRGLPGDVGTGVPSDGPPFPCSALLLVGVAEPPGSPRALVRSYRTVSPLPVTGEPVHRRSVLCCPIRQVTPSWLSPAPCPLEPRLSSVRSCRAAATRPTHRRHHVTGRGASHLR